MTSLPAVSLPDPSQDRKVPDPALAGRLEKWWSCFWISGVAMVLLSALATYSYCLLPDFSRIGWILWIIGIPSFVALEVMIVSVVQFMRLRYLGSREMTAQPLSGDSVLMIPSCIQEAA